MEDCGEFETCFNENTLRLSVKATQLDVEATNDQIKFQAVKHLLTENQNSQSLKVNNILCYVYKPRVFINIM